jgi:hypothetical protein
MGEGLEVREELGFRCGQTVGVIAIVPCRRVTAKERPDVFRKPVALPKLASGPLQPNQVWCAPTYW